MNKIILLANSVTAAACGALSATAEIRAPPHVQIGQRPRQPPSPAKRRDRLTGSGRAKQTSPAGEVPRKLERR
jgi:hypothetical protein